MKYVLSTAWQIITGFLGAGKTTLVNYVLNENHGKKICGAPLPACAACGRFCPSAWANLPSAGRCGRGEGRAEGRAEGLQCEVRC